MYYDEALVRKVLELRSKGLGYREIGARLNIDKNTVWRICKAVREGKIKIGENGSISYKRKPAGVILLQKLGLWDPRTRKYTLPQPQASGPLMKPAHIPPAPMQSGLKLEELSVYELKIAKPRKGILNDLIKILNPGFPPPGPPPGLIRYLLQPDYLAHEYAEVKCPKCAKTVKIRDDWSEISCLSCGSLIRVQWI